jgi:hypothetical protein
MNVAGGKASKGATRKNSQTGSDNTAAAEDEDPENAGNFENGDDGEVE